MLYAISADASFIRTSPRFTISLYILSTRVTAATITTIDERTTAHFSHVMLFIIIL